MKKVTYDYLMQRVSAILLLPLSLWCTISVLKLLEYGDHEKVKDFISSPVNLVAVIIFIVLFIYHGLIGIRVIIDDYVQSLVIKKVTVFLLYSLSILSCFVGILALFYGHLVARIIVF